MSAWLVQDFGVVESMIVKMACGAPSLAAHVSLPSLRAAAAALPPHAMAAPLGAAVAASSGMPADGAAAMLQGGGGREAGGGVRGGSAVTAGGVVAAADVTVERLAALQRWVDGGEYDRTVRACAVEKVRAASVLPRLQKLWPG